MLGEVLSYADFLVLDRKLTLSLQPLFSRALVVSSNTSALRSSMKTVIVES